MSWCSGSSVVTSSWGRRLDGRAGRAGPAGRCASQGSPPPVRPGARVGHGVPARRPCAAPRGRSTRSWGAGAPRGRVRWPEDRAPRPVGRRRPSRRSPATTRAWRLVVDIRCTCGQDPQGQGMTVAEPPHQSLANSARDAEWRRERPRRGGGRRPPGWVRTAVCRPAARRRCARWSARVRLGPSRPSYGLRGVAVHAHQLGRVDRAGGRESPSYGTHGRALPPRPTASAAAGRATGRPRQRVSTLPARPRARLTPPRPRGCRCASR